ncbi:MAG: iron-sulfur cluster biosynthesis family protein, partial [Janthinobacterium lividum]
MKSENTIRPARVASSSSSILIEQGSPLMTVTTSPITITAPPVDGVLLTDEAAGKVKALLESEGRDDLALRVAVQPGGCSGLRYQLFFDERQLDGDVRKDFGGVSVVTDRMSAP